MSNTSGQGATAVVPDEIRGWNWGAFLLNWIWGIGNNTLIALRMFVSLVNLVMAFVLGAKGSEWAWRNKTWQDVEHFRRTQRTWARVGLAVWVLGAVFMVGLVFAIGAAMKQSEAYQMGTALMAQDARVTERFGSPLSFGRPMGSIETSGPGGSAKLSFAVEGPLGNGRAFVEAEKRMGSWTLLGLEVEDEASGERLRLLE